MEGCPSNHRPFNRCATSLQDDSRDDGDREAAPGRVILGVLSKYGGGIGLTNVILVVVMSRERRHIQAEASLSRAERCHVYRACAQNVLDRHGREAMSDDIYKSLPIIVLLIGLAIIALIGLPLPTIVASLGLLGFWLCKKFVVSFTEAS